MIGPITQTPPTVALMLGFFMALALKRGRVSQIIDNFLPMTKDE